MSALTSSTLRLEARGGRPEGAEQPLRRRTHGGPSGAFHVRRTHATSVPLSARSDGPRLGGLRRGRRLAARMELELCDADRQSIDLAPERRPDRVSNREIHLSRDLRDRQAVGDAEVQPDRERPAGNGDA